MKISKRIVKSVLSFVIVISLLFAATYSAGALSSGNTEDLYMDTQQIDSLMSHIRESLANRESSVTISTVFTNADAESSAKNLADYIYDHIFDYCSDPEYADYLKLNITSFSASYSLSGYSGNMTFKYTMVPEYYTNSVQEQQVREFSESFVKNLEELSDYDKIIKIYNYIVENVDYDMSLGQDGLGDIVYSAYSAIINKKTVCQGFAALFYRLAMEAGVPCRVITGRANGGTHAWNIVKMQDRYFCIDTSWAVSTSDADKYFLKGSVSFEDHLSNEEYLTDEFMTEYPISKVDYYNDDPEDFVEKGSISQGIVYEIYKNSEDTGSDTYTLFIRGSGNMPDYTPSSVMPWASYREKITAAVVGEGITYAGSYTFAYMPELKSLTLNDSVTQTGDYLAFGCPLLDQIYLSLYTETGAFIIGGEYGSTVWEYDPIMEKLTISGNGRMGQPFNSVNNTYSTDFVPWRSFRDAVYEIDIKEGVTNISTFAFFGMKQLVNVYLPSTLQEIGTQSFRLCTSLTWIEIPSGVVNISTRAFEDCSGLMSFYIPDGVFDIGVRAIGYTNDQEKIEGITVYGTEGSEAQRYASDNGLDFSLWDQGPSTFTDPNTGISVVTDDIGVSLIVSFPSNDEKLRVDSLAPKAAGVISSYEIELLKNNCITVRNSTVEISIPVSGDYNMKYCRVAKVSDDKFEYIDCTAIGNHIVVDTKLDGSVIALIYKEPAVRGDADADGELTVSDCSFMQKYLAGIIDYRDIDIEAAQISSDEISVSDISRIQMYMAGMISVL